MMFSRRHGGRLQRAGTRAARCSRTGVPAHAADLARHLARRPQTAPIQFLTVGWLGHRKGADMIFAEACTELAQFEAFVRAVGVPVLANITEFGKTPLFTVDELCGAGVAMVLYPLSAFRAMNAAAVATYRAIREDGTQRAIVDRMQTREELYEILNYHAAEQQLDRAQKS